MLSILSASAALSSTARAVLLDASATRNTAAPTGTLSNTGWQWEGQYGDYLGTPIGPHYFITAKHVSGFNLAYNGQTYPLTSYYDNPNADLRIWHVLGTFGSYAPLYTANNEGSGSTGKTALITGRGTQRGAAVVVTVGTITATHGWQWGAADHVQSWGQNVVAGSFNAGGGAGQLLQWDFDHGVTNEGALSDGDSGGGDFINDGTGWKLAGINYTADGYYSTTGTNGTGFPASIYDSSGLYIGSDGNWQSAGTGPGSSYSTRISSNISWINSILAIPQPTWKTNGSGNWGTLANWNPEIPQGQDAEAIFGSAITGAATITLDNTPTVGTINFNNASTYTLAGPGPLYIQAQLGPCAINVTSGSHKIICVTQVNTDTTFNVNGSSTLTMEGTINFNSGVDITKSGAGTVIVSGWQYWNNVGNVNVNGGIATVGALDGGGGVVTVASGARLNAARVRKDTLTVNGSALMSADSSANGVSNVKTLNIGGTTNAWTGKLDLNTNSLVIDYTSTSPLANIINQIKQGYNNGAWNGNGITSAGAAATAGTGSRTALGVALSTDIYSSFPATFKGQTIDNTAVLIRYTAWGDTNFDGTVDTVDFNNLAASFGGSGKRWVNGDINYDGIVDTVDFNAMAANFGFFVAENPLGGAAAASSIVPEPIVGMSVSLALAASALLRRRGRAIQR